MALDGHPNVFYFEGRTWVSELPADEALAQLRAQRAWDKATIRAQRWWVAITIGAALGTAGAWWFAALVGAPTLANLLFVPVGFAIGAVVGAIINKRVLGEAILIATSTERPPLVALTKVPARVLRTADSNSTVEHIIELCGGKAR